MKETLRRFHLREDLGHRSVKKPQGRHVGLRDVVIPYEQLATSSAEGDVHKGLGRGASALE